VASLQKAVASMKNQCRQSKKLWRQFKISGVTRKSCIVNKKSVTSLQKAVASIHSGITAKSCGVNSKSVVSLHKAVASMKNQ